MEIYPDLEGEEIHSMLMQIKQQNNGSFKNLTVKDISERVSELKGIYYLYKIHTCYTCLHAFINSLESYQI